MGAHEAPPKIRWCLFNTINLLNFSYFKGLWRSWLARLYGIQKVGSSNLPSSTMTPLLKPSTKADSVRAANIQHQIDRLRVEQEQTTDPSTGITQSA